MGTFLTQYLPIKGRKKLVITKNKHLKFKYTSAYFVFGLKIKGKFYYGNVDNVVEYALI